MQTKLKGKKLKKVLSRKTQFDLLNFQACCSFKIQTVFFKYLKKTEVFITYGFHVFLSFEISWIFLFIDNSLTELCFEK